jgi:hypothetical protein
MAAAAAMLWPGITALGRGQPAPPGTPCFPVAFLATARPDGSPRLHPFCPVLAGGRLLAGPELAATTGGKSACPRPAALGQYRSSGSKRPRFTPDLGRGQSRGVIPARYSTATDRRIWVAGS